MLTEANASLSEHRVPSVVRFLLHHNILSHGSVERHRDADARPPGRFEVVLAEAPLTMPRVQADDSLGESPLVEVP